MKIEEIMARAGAGHYGKGFDHCCHNQASLKNAFRSGYADINDPTQEDHINAMKDVIAALEQAGYEIKWKDTIQQAKEDM